MSDTDTTDSYESEKNRKTAVNIHNMSESEGDSPDEFDISVETPDREVLTRSTKEILHDVVSSPLDFEKVKEPGPLTLEDFADEDNEYYIFRFPSGFLNPSDLVGNKLKMKSGSSQIINLNNNSYELSLCKHSSLVDTPTVFLPDESGQLCQADLEISGQISMKKVPIASSDVQQININDLRTRRHKSPEIKERNFFGNPGSSYPLGNTPKEKKNKGKKRKSAVENSFISSQTDEIDGFRTGLPKEHKKLGKGKSPNSLESSFKASPFSKKGFSGLRLTGQEKEIESRIKKEVITPKRKVNEQEIRIKKEVVTPKKSRKSIGATESPVKFSPNKSFKKEFDFF